MKRIGLLLALLLWPLAASAQIVSPGGGQMLSSATIVGGNCTNPQFVQGLSTTGTPTCATPSLGSGVPNGAPPQFVGYSATNVGEAETLGGDATLTRTGTNAYSLVVTKTNGTVFSTLATASIPLAVSLGGTGSGAAAAAGQILVAQSATAFAPVAVSGDATITNGGAITVTKTAGTAFTAFATTTPPLSIALGGRGSATAPTAGQIDIAQSGTAFGAVTLAGDCTIVAAGTITCTKSNGTLLTGLFAPLVNPASGQNNYAPLASASLSNPTFTGTLTFPDGSTYTTAGHNNMLALGIGVPASTTAGQLLNAQYNGNGSARFLITNNSTGTGAAALMYFSNGTNSSWIMHSGTAYTASGPNIPADSLEVASNGANGIVIATNATISPGPIINFWSGSANPALINQYGLNLPANPPNGYAALTFGPVASPDGSMSYGGDGQLRMQGGATFTNGQWIKTASAGLTGAALFQVGANSGGDGVNPGLQLYLNTGLTPGASFTPTLLLNVNPTSMWLVGENGSTPGVVLGWVESGQSVIDPVMLNWPAPGGVFNMTSSAGSHYAGGNWVSDAIYSMATGLSYNGLIIYSVTASQTIGATTAFQSVAEVDGNSFRFSHVGADQNWPAPTVAAGESLYAGSRDSYGAATASSGNTIDLYFAKGFTSGATCICTFNGQPWTCYNSARSTTHVQFACYQYSSGPACPLMDITYLCFSQN